MDLIGWGPNGRLDPFCACMLLWSESVSFEREAITWDGSAHHIGDPVIHRDVVSLYGVSAEEIRAVVPDLLALLQLLDRDGELRVPCKSVADSVIEQLPCGELTGMTLFLLQSGTHALMVERDGGASVRVRYDGELSRGIPNLEDVLSRMLELLWGFMGSDDAFTVRFVQKGLAAGAPRTLHGFVHETDDASGPSESSTSPEQASLRRAALLATKVYTIEALRGSAQERLADYETEKAQLEVSKPDARSKEYRAPSAASLGIPTARNVVRTLAVRSVLYLAIGLLLVLVGRDLVYGGERLVQQATMAVNYVMGVIGDVTSLALGQTQQLGVHELIKLPVESLKNGSRIVGIMLITVGILFPVLKILRLRRRLKREQDFSRSHVSAIAAMAEKSRQHAEASYAIDLDAWASSLASLEEDVSFAKRSLAELDAAQTSAGEELRRLCESMGIPDGMRDLSALCTLADYVDSGKATNAQDASELYAGDLTRSEVSSLPEHATAAQPTLRSAARTTDSIVRSVRAEPSEQERYGRIVKYCG